MQFQICYILLNLQFFFADVDECDMIENICGANSSCQNYDGGFNCTCDAGFEMIDGSCLGEFYHRLCPEGSLSRGISVSLSNWASVRRPPRIRKTSIVEFMLSWY